MKPIAVLKQVWTMENADLCSVGVHLGYDHNQVCEEIAKAGFFAEDGAGTFVVSRGEDHGNDVINHIMNEIFAAYTRVHEITISN